MQNDAEGRLPFSTASHWLGILRDPGTEGTVSARRILSRERVSWGTRHWMVCSQERVAQSSSQLPFNNLILRPHLIVGMALMVGYAYLDFCIKAS